MAKISISGALKKRSRLRMFTILACLFLVFVLVQMVISQGTSRAHAGAYITATSCLISTSGYYDTTIPAGCENKDVTISGNGNWHSIIVYADTTPISRSNPAASAAGCDVVWYLSNANKNNGDCDSTRHFKSLSLLNGATLTHSPISRDDMIREDNSDYGGTANGSLADNTIGLGRIKKIDLVISGALIMDNSNIDVSGAGYPSGIGSGDSTFWGNNCQSGPPPQSNPFWKFWTGTAWCYLGGGFGPGGGGNSLGGSANNHNWGGGGGYGNYGNNGITQNAASNMFGGGSIGGKSYGDAKINSFEWGSAGGNGNGSGEQSGMGGAGGGRIRIVAGSVIFQTTNCVINADGLNGTVDPSGKDNMGGGGSGGTISITTGTFSGPTPSYAPLVDSGSHFNDLSLQDKNLSGTTNILGFPIDLVSTLRLTTPPNISAQGGASYVVWPNDQTWKDFYSYGSGGRIYLNMTSAGAGAVTLSKKLVAVSRSGMSPTDNFNPYALQVGDTIQVVLTLGSFSGTISTLEDKYLTNGTVSCKNTGTPSNGGTVSGTGDGITWSNVVSGTTQLSYTCKVQ